MFYSAIYQKQPDMTLRETRRMKIIGFLVRIGKEICTVQPSAKPVIKQGQKQFWFYHNHIPLIAVQEKNGTWYVKK